MNSSIGQAPSAANIAGAGHSNVPRPAPRQQQRQRAHTAPQSPTTRPLPPLTQGAGPSHVRRSSVIPAGLPLPLPPARAATTNATLTSPQEGAPAWADFVTQVQLAEEAFLRTYSDRAPTNMSSGIKAMLVMHEGFVFRLDPAPLKPGETLTATLDRLIPASAASGLPRVSFDPETLRNAPESHFSGLSKAEARQFEKKTHPELLLWAAEFLRAQGTPEEAIDSHQLLDGIKKNYLMGFDFVGGSIKYGRRSQREVFAASVAALLFRRPFATSNPIPPTRVFKGSVGGEDVTGSVQATASGESLDTLVEDLCQAADVARRKPGNDKAQAALAAAGAALPTLNKEACQLLGVLNIILRNDDGHLGQLLASTSRDYLIQIDWEDILGSVVGEDRADRGIVVGGVETALRAPLDMPGCDEALTPAVREAVLSAIDEIRNYAKDVAAIFGGPNSNALVNLNNTLDALEAALADPGNTPSVHDMAAAIFPNWSTVRESALQLGELTGLQPRANNWHAAYANQVSTVAVARVHVDGKPPARN